ncbi:1-deoxy-D-xylulose-5-phosphate reductoisomerase [Hirschia baltica]|uniref:1-deoxy-D-xylulose 5-phosphate reductoisomerase n=1 Tax=Hirschia baltica (strain ATCC 49814 / DSM 5838 / IFAM 1418) TaxID=582402 RepID=C6XJV4_HIRBI|nr:1-deoxy-D-xylulose-5-phosphate reductoisomerase [Hirschia baltica]ACT59399.1 1-deoxy-D-xylulose 5-phosphate reductoisomerase [Hirschia baltica ATCC 49814]
MSEQVKVSLLGATGSIGSSTISILKQNCADMPEFKVVSLTAQNSVQELAKLAIETNAEFAAIGNENKYQELKDLLAGTGIECASGETGLVDAAARQCDTLVSAITGAAALRPTLEGIKQGAKIALANKESIVCAGVLFLSEAKKYNATLLPVDSEHNAIFQVLDNHKRVEKLILTASGGPFRTSTIDEMREATPEQAISHPNWSMGAKISVDSATMMNKSLELIEASYLFNTPEEKIDVLIHPQSIVHSLVSYDDGSVLAQLGMPDMRTPISYALAWPNRMPVPGLERLDLGRIGSLSFETPDDARFPAVSLARKALTLGAWAPNVINAVNEIAVDAFLNNVIGFMDITRTTEKLLDRFASDEFGAMTDPNSFDDVFELDGLARKLALEAIKA